MRFALIFPRFSGFRTMTESSVTLVLSHLPAISGHRNRLPLAVRTTTFGVEHNDLLGFIT